MYARITNTKHDPYRIDEAIEIVRQRVLPAAKQQKGYHGYIMLVERSTGKTLTITLWEGEEELTMTGENSGYYRDAISQVVPLLTSEPFVEDYEVVIQE